MKNKKTLILSDLDGTFLGSKDYGFGSGRTLIESLGIKGIPVILVTSKTASEVKRWQKKLGLNTPYAIENGSAIYFPRKDFPEECFRGFNVKIENDMWSVVFGTPLAEITQLTASFTDHISDLVNCSLKAAVSMTGLPIKDAKLAQQRKWTLPLYIKGSREREKIALKALSVGLRCVFGGRFLHIQGECDKGQALEVIRKIYERRDKINYEVVAVGDDHNDISMLEKADVAVVVNSLSSPLDLSRPDTIRTVSIAPEGWVEGVELALNRT